MGSQKVLTTIAIVVDLLMQSDDLLNFASHRGGTKNKFFTVLGLAKNHYLQNKNKLLIIIPIDSKVQQTRVTLKRNIS